MDYYGPVVNRCARVADSAHGGQVVATDEVKRALDEVKASLARSELPLCA
jgi:class 3 adenylate cyclase